MSISILNLRTFGIGSKPESLEPGQICFNLTEKRIFVGDGSDYLTTFDGNKSPGSPGLGWYEMPMGNEELAEFFIQNPASLGDNPTNGQVLSWNSILNQPVWTTITPGGPTSGAVYQTTNAAVQAAPGNTVTEKINAALDVSPTTVCAAIVSGFPGDEYQGLYYFTNGFWVFAANYADPTATEVFYSDINSGLSVNNVQEAIDVVNDKATIAITDASSAVSTANAAQATANTAASTANAANAAAQTAQNTANAAAAAATTAQTTATAAASAAALAQNTANAASATAAAAQNTANSAAVTATTAQNTANSALSLAQQAIPDTILTTKGQLIVATGAGTYTAFSSGTNGQFLVADSSTSSGLNWISVIPGVVISITGISPISVDNTDPSNPVISVNAASTTSVGVVQLNDTTSSTSTTQAATANAVKLTYDLASTAQSSAAAAQGTANTALSTAQQAIPNSTLTAKGQLIVGTGTSTYTALSSGSNGQFLVVDSAQPSGLRWASSAPGTVSSVTGINPIAVNNTDPSNPVISANAASVTSAGVVQLNNSTSSTSTTEAATANAVKTTYDLANAALPKAGGTLTGTLYSIPLQTPGIASASDLGLVAEPSTGLIKSLTAFDGGLY